MPYEAIAIVVCYVYSRRNTPNADQARRVRQWFWRSSFDERYRGASEHFVSRDLEGIHKFVVGGAGKPDEFGLKPRPDIWQTVDFRSNNSRSRAFVLALALQGPRNLTNGVAINPAEALSSYNQKEFHHIYPRHYLKKSGVSDNQNCMANICILAASENRLISDTDPHVYLPKCMADLGKEAIPVFASNLLPDPMFFDYNKGSFHDFTTARAALIVEKVDHLCEGDAQ